MRELSLNILDIVQNSISAGSSLIEISVIENTYNSSLDIVVKDNGIGMSKQQSKLICDPFFTTKTTKKVGLGVPLFKMAAEQTGGYIKIESKLHCGTSVIAHFNTSHIDMKPIGDVNSIISLLIQCCPNIDFLYRRCFNSAKFKFDTREIKKILSGVPIDTPEIMQWINKFLKQKLNLIMEVCH